MPSLRRSEYYPWFADSSANLPKDRFLNKDFLKSERERIEHARQWDTKYREADRGDKLDEYITYVIPVDMSKILKKEVNERGFKILGTSALRNSAQLEKLALFPEDMQLPDDYSLIRIFEPEKEIVLFKGDVYGTDAIIVEDFESLSIDYLYQNVNSSDIDMFDLLGEWLGGDDLMTHSIHAPMISSPQNITGTGGIGSCSLSPTTRFAKTLNKQVARILPPEYTEYNPPSRDTSGFSERHSKGRGRKIVYNTAEKIPNANSHVGLKSGDSYEYVHMEAKHRTTFPGEYSYLGNVVPDGGRDLHVAQDTLEHFTQNEITISSFDELKEADVDLSRVNDSIVDYEDVWINVVEARQVMPDVGDQRADQEKWIRDLTKDWEIFLPQMGFNDTVHHLAELRAEQTYKNLLRLAQQFARSDKREQVTDQDMKDAHWNFKAQAERLLGTDLIKDAAQGIKGSHSTDRESVVHTFLKSKPCVRNELVSRLLDTSKFNKGKKTEKYIQRMIDRGYLYKSPDGKLHPT
ncbi:hypothetical protein [Halovivax cerinus]|uniref:Uncharacterized protein n=1 Tax=Halovivax cerinus TaxID=1487865 RepID=A0ABD5NQ95_9EURY|nr:hypothetical protein [Halovivax cerinus]